MPTAIVHPERITQLSDREPRAEGHALYWMQASVRTRENHALEHAVRLANDLGRSLLVAFVLDRNYPDATPRSFAFLAEGLVDVASKLHRRGIGFTVLTGDPPDEVRALCRDAAVLVTDRGYLRRPRSWRRSLADELDIPVVEVETNVVVPVEAASDKREWAARTIRPKLHERCDEFLEALTTTPLERRWDAPAGGVEASDAGALLRAIGVERPSGAMFTGGERTARRVLDRFVESGLDSYREAGVRPDGSASSRLSMFLHFGHISPSEVVRAVRSSGASQESISAFVEEVLVRRELAHNYVWFEPDYDRYAALPDWSRTTLAEHAEDDREAVYTAKEMEHARTDDRAWNAAMIEMRETGYLHNRLRMYWGKQILRWTNTPEYAHRVCLELNDRYLLDGRDPNSYANVGWVFGLHDQAFAEQPVIGKVRPMTRSGLERKIDVDAYVDHVADVTGHEIPGR